ncbi:TRAP-type C4-dicarboxylate transport system permease small subunit [Rhodovulum imhoffii]|uniref:TRAP transporter small permease protein n=1 Tax=Rhodovulum imhoffii TaxID=365340 RepID=A0A2T5BTM2_9RHOB|nr:TRAP transporter small permease [Rhodovulum imhoffii]MBK5934145.1 hypothetical protein [Rhodovulum imhoffii]PTN02781.1 TRAP-type C4-dicarboxylate transport system permease small subunit [Rhodovulum imhoffii]
MTLLSLSLTRVARVLAMTGGAVLLAIAGVTVVSILGRALPGLPPVTGDYELTEAGTAIALFCFLPWCQLNRAHVSVDLLTRRLPRRLEALSGLLADAVMMAVAGVILWRLWLGFAEKFPHGGPALRAVLNMGPPPVFAETTYDLQIPLWVPYALCLPGAGLFALATLASLIEAFRRGAGHL